MNFKIQLDNVTGPILFRPASNTAIASNHQNINSNKLQKTREITYKGIPPQSSLSIIKANEKLTTTNYEDSGLSLELAANRDPLLATFFHSANLGLHPKNFGFNHPQHLPVNPYLALLLSHYGRYIPVYGEGKGIYGYAAANNYHNNQPFGAYKLYVDRNV